MSFERYQTRLLTRTFFARLFESELIPPGLAQAQVVISVFAFLAAPSLILPLMRVKRYIGGAPPEALRPFMAWDRTMALLLAMTATAFIALVIWENVFPDRRDSRNLGVLPVPHRAFVIARLLAVTGLFAVLFLATAALSSFAFGILASMARFPEGFLRVAVAHFASFAAAQAFVFFGVVAVQCALMSVAGPAAAHRLAVVLQLGMIVAVLQMPMVMPGDAGLGLTSAGRPLWLDSVSANLLPPLWFLSMYQTLVGSPYAGTSGIASTAIALGSGTPVVALAFYALSYRRLTRLAIEGRPEPHRGRAPWPGRVLRRITSAPMRPQAAAVCAFTLRTLARSRQHRMLLAIWIGVATALTISAPMPLLVSLGWAALDQPREALLVGPFLFSALVLAGMRSLFAIPTELRANWAIRMNEPPVPRWVVDGAGAALIIAGVAAPAALALGSGTLLWGPVVGTMHAAFCATVGLLLVQIALARVDRLPFTCSYSPGAARIGTLWPFYLTLFSVLTYGMAAAEAALLRHPRGYVTFLTVVAVGIVLTRWLRLRRVRTLPGLCFDAEPDDTLTVVRL